MRQYIPSRSSDSIRWLPHRWPYRKRHPNCARASLRSRWWSRATTNGKSGADVQQFLIDSFLNFLELRFIFRNFCCTFWQVCLHPLGWIETRTFWKVSFSYFLYEKLLIMYSFFPSFPLKPPPRRNKLVNIFFPIRQIFPLKIIPEILPYSRRAHFIKFDWCRRDFSSPHSL